MSTAAIGQAYSYKVVRQFVVAINDDGTLTYSFVEALHASHPGFVVRFAGGVFFLSGMLLMAYNTWRTVRVADVAMAEREAQIA